MFLVRRDRGRLMHVAQRLFSAASRLFGTRLRPFYRFSSTARKRRDEGRARRRRLVDTPKSVEMSLDAANKSVCATLRQNFNRRVIAFPYTIWPRASRTYIMILAPTRNANVCIARISNAQCASPILFCSTDFMDRKTQNPLIATCVFGARHRGGTGRWQCRPRPDTTIETRFNLLPRRVTRSLRSPTI